MPYKPATIVQSDIARVIRAMRDAGYEVRVRITGDGVIIEPVPKVDTDSQEHEQEKVIAV